MAGFSRLLASTFAGVVEHSRNYSCSPLSASSSQQNHRMSPLPRRTFVQQTLLVALTAGLRSPVSAAEKLPPAPDKTTNPAHRPRLPRVTAPYVNIYKPGADVYTLPTVTSRDGLHTYTQGVTYPDWRVNDHTFIKDPSGRWHCFGITRPWVSGDNGHAGEGLCFHAVAPEGTFAQTVTFQSWRDLPKINVAGSGWAPTVVKIGDEYSLIGSHLGRATSRDLHTWKNAGKLTAKGGNRDPHIVRLGDTYYLLRCADNGIVLVTSTDFVNWSEPKLIFKPEKPSQHTESPFLVAHEGLFYLFWTLWDTADKTTSGYCPRTYVYCSDNPADFRGRPLLTEFTAHAPEIIQDEDGQWFLSSADYPHRGINVAPLIWE
jgi:beta-fructofuranosidase